MNGMEMITAERSRQIRKDWTPEHDLCHRAGGLVVVAAKILVDGTDATFDDPLERGDWDIIDKWQSKEPNSDLRRIRLLSIVGALVAAEIDRTLHNLLTS